MRIIMGDGCWPGEAAGTAVWVESLTQVPHVLAPDRPEEILRFRAEVSRALEDLDVWSGSQETVSARVLFQSYRETLLEKAWLHRVAALIDTQAVSAAVATLDAAAQVGAALGRNEDLAVRAEHLGVVARWLAGRLLPRHAHPPGAIFVGRDLSPLEILDLPGPVVLAAPDPGVSGPGPLVYGVSGPGPEWAGCSICIHGTEVQLDPPRPWFWELREGQMKGIPICPVDGAPEAVGRMSHDLGRPPVALVRRLDDLAALPLYVPHAAAVAVDLERLGRLASLQHPGVRLLFATAAATAAAAGLPLLAGGKPALADPEHWLQQGFTGIYGELPPQEGAHSHALRRRQESSL